MELELTRLIEEATRGDLSTAQALDRLYEILTKHAQASWQAPCETR